MILLNRKNKISICLCWITNVSENFFTESTVKHIALYFIQVSTTNFLKYSLTSVGLRINKILNPLKHKKIQFTKKCESSIQSRRLKLEEINFLTKKVKQDEKLSRDEKEISHIFIMWFYQES